MLASIRVREGPEEGPALFQFFLGQNIFYQWICEQIHQCTSNYSGGIDRHSHSKREKHGRRKEWCLEQVQKSSKVNPISVFCSAVHQQACSWQQFCLQYPLKLSTEIFRESDGRGSYPKTLGCPVPLLCRTVSYPSLWMKAVWVY